MTDGERKALILALVILALLLGAAFRFHRLGAQSLWYDEGVAYAHSTRTLPELIPLLQPNVHVPAYFTALGWWQDLTGSSEFALRSLSALLSVISVAWAYALGARLVHPTAGLAAAALTAFNSFSIYYAQEARMYAMLTAIAGASMWLFVDCLRAAPGDDERGIGWRRIAALGFINALGVYTHVAFALVILTQAAWASLRFCISLAGEPQAERRRPPARHWFKLQLANALTAVLFLPWLPVAISQLGNRSHRLQHAPIEQMLREIFGVLAFGNTFEYSASALSVVVLFFLLLGLFPSRSRGRAGWDALLPAAWAVISTVVFLYVGFGDDFLRLLLPAQLAVAVWLGRGLWALWTFPRREWRFGLRALPRLAAAVALGAILIALGRGLELLYQHPDFQRDDMRGLARELGRDIDESDAVIVSAAGLAELLRYYYRGEAPVFGLPRGGDDAETRAQVLELIAAFDRLHVIFYGAEQQDPKQVVENTLNLNAFEIDDRWVDDLRYALYLSDPILAEPTMLARDFGSEISLRSVSLGAVSLEPGAVLPVQLVWRALAAPGGRYKVFLQLLNSEGALVAQRDSEPAGGSSRTTSWRPGATIFDNHGLFIPPDIPPGEYQLIAGLYDIGDPTARLGLGGESHLELGRIEVVGAG